MTTQRLIQNFRRARGLLWAGSDFNADGLERSLMRLGVSLTRVESIASSALDPDRDIVFLDADQQVNPSVLFRADTNMTAAPVIGIVGVEAPSRLRLLAEAGATAILRKPIASGTVYSALFLGVNNYRRMESAETRLAIVSRKQRGRRYLIKAIIALIKERNVGDDEAYASLRREAMRRRLDLEEFCEALFVPGSPFPANWPSLASRNTLSQQQGELHEEDRDSGGRPGGLDDPADGARRRSNQARRA
jgi:AmiR/NasT family two-component response regulator